MLMKNEFNLEGEMMRGNHISLKQVLLYVACASTLLISALAIAQTTTPGIEDACVVPLPKETYGYRGMPGSIVELKDGTLLMSYSRMTPQGQADGSIVGRRSPDKGKTWGDEFTLIPRPMPESGPDRYCHPSFLRLANDQLLLSYIYSSADKPPFGDNYYRRSTDDGKTWGDQLIVTPHPGYNIVHNDKLIQLSTGRVLAPIEYELNTTGGDHAGYVSYTVYSDDNGYSWHESKNMVNMLPVEAQEPHLVELKDGRLMMLMRTYSGYVARAYSSDKGESWSEGRPIPELKLPKPSSALNIKRIPKTGDLLLLRCSSGPDAPPMVRTPFVSVLSKNDGDAWENEKALMADPEDDYGYPSLLFTDDIAVISYHQRDGLHVMRVPVDWFYAK
jgi:sialidase-1